MLIEHLERHCGSITEGWADEATKIQVAHLSGGPVDGTRTLATIGLSNHELTMHGGGTVRLELVMLHRDVDGAGTFPQLLLGAALRAHALHRAYLRGDVIEAPGQPLYVAAPVYFPDSFGQLVPPAGKPIVFAWLVPITAGEARLIQARGWEYFEDQLERFDPDLLDPGRPHVDALVRA